jgi:hypothetical protein
VERHAEIDGAGVREVVIFPSEGEDVEGYHGNLPFEAIGDPDGFFYERCGVGTSWSALRGFDALGPCLQEC